jgi:uncharacterized delta-60 repeat protein
MKKIKILSLSSIAFLSACSPADISNLPKTNGSESLVFSEQGADFGEVIIGDTVQKELVMTNNGNSVVRDLSVSFNLGPSLNIQQNTCSGDLSVGGSCVLKFTYSATATSLISGRYSVNYTDSTQRTKSFEIKGKAVTKSILSFSSSQVNFGEVAVTGKKSSVVTLTNNGGATADIRIKNLIGDNLVFAGGVYPGSGGTCSNKVPGNSSCSIVIENAPSESRQYLGSLSLSYFDGKEEKATNVVSISAVGKSAANLSSASGSVFDQTVIGSNRVKQIDIVNSGEFPAAVSVSSVNGSGFSLDQSSPVSIQRCGVQVAPGQTCALLVKFTPSAEGTATGIVSVVYNNGVESKQYTHSLSAQAVTPALVKLVGQSPISFGQSTIGIKVSKELTFENTGGASAQLFSLSSLGGTYTYDGGVFPGVGGTCSAVILGKSSCKVVIAHTATTVGTDNRPVSFNYNNGINSVSEQIIMTASATGQASLVFTAGQNQSVGLIALNSSKSVNVELKNLGLSAASAVVVQRVDNAGTQTESIVNVTPAGCSQMNSASTCSIPLTILGNQVGPVLTKIQVSYVDSVGVSRANSINITGSVDIFSELLTSVGSYNFSEVFTTSVNEKVITLTNNGTTKITGIQGTFVGAGLSYKGGSYPGTGGTCALELNASQSCSVSLVYAPTQASVLSGSFNLVYNNQFESRTVSVQLSGSARSVATLSVSSNFVNLGKVRLNESSVFEILYTNNGDVPANLVSSTNLQGPFFFLDQSFGAQGVFPGFGGTCSTQLNPGQSCSVKGLYLPIASGQTTTQFDVRYNNGLEEKTSSVVLSGTGVNVSKLAGISSFDFGVVSVGEPSQLTVGLTNTGGEHATGVSVSSSDPLVSIVSNSCGGLIQSQSSCEVVIKYSPTFEGEVLSSSINVSFNDGVSQTTKTVSLAGIGGVPMLGDLAIFPSAPYEFGEVPINQAKFITLDLFNSGTGEASAVSISQVAPPYFIVPSIGANPDCGAVIFAGESCSITVEFAPLERAAYSQALSIGYNDGLIQKTLDISLSGLGVFVPGTVDENFGQLGLVVYQVPGDISSHPTGVHVQQSGKIVLSGMALIPDERVFSVRFNSDGTLDQTYSNGNGVLIEGVVAGSYKSIGLANDSMLNFGYAGNDFSLAKIIPNGLMDSNFGIGGRVAQLSINRPDYSYSGVELSDGKIMSVGTRNEDAYIERLLPNGSLDLSFNGTGSVSLDVDNSIGLDELRFILPQSDGKYVVGGGSMIGNGGMNGTLIRLNSDGTIDQTYGTQGITLVNVMGTGEKYITDALLVEDNKVLALVLAQNNALAFELAEFEMYLAKFNSDGTYDLTFNNGLGFVHLANWGSSGLISDFRMLKQADGKILIAGNKNNGFGYDLAVTRVLQDGSIDFNFGTFGEYIVPDSESFGDYSIALALQPDGEIILGGKRTIGLNADEILLTRIHK